METRTWMLGTGSVVLGIAVTSGVVHYRDAHQVPTEIKAGERLEVDREGARRIQSLEERERSLAERERALSEKVLAATAKDLLPEGAPSPTHDRVGTAPNAEHAHPDSKSPLARMLTSQAKMSETAMVKEMLRQADLQIVQEIYGSLLAEWGLDRENLSTIQNLLTGQIMDPGTFLTQVMDGNRPIEDLLRSQEEFFAKNDAALAKHLSPDRIRQLRALEQSAPPLGTRQLIATLNLQPWQKEQMLPLLTEEHRRQDQEDPFTLFEPPMRWQRKTAEQLRRSRELLSNEAVAREVYRASLGSLAESHARILARAQSVLTPEQLAALRQSQQEELQMVEAELESMPPGYRP